ncbi:MAG: hypothetical protein INR71_03280 [Terriglobus roseus]|nr:hypothetical protein [Terriglobus roseus]
MSISSILGGTSSSSSGGPPPLRRSPPPAAAASSPSAKSMRPPSPRSNLHNGSRSEHPYWRRPQTPERGPPGSAARPEQRPYSTSSPQVYGGATTSPDYAHPPSSLHRYTSSHPADIGADSRASSRLWGPENGAPARPNSQPASAHSLPPPPPLTHEPSDPARYRGALFGPSNAEQWKSDDDQQRSRSTSDPRYGERDRPTTVQPISGAAYNPPVDQRYGGAYYSPGRQPPAMSQDLSRDKRNEEQATLAPYGSFRPQPAYSAPSGYGSNVASSPSKQDVHQPPQGVADVRSFRPASEQPLPRPQDAYGARPSGHYNGIDRRADEYSTAPPDAPPRSHPYDPPMSRFGEELQHQRSHLNISPETIRRQVGRNSPLPQAVQGAQAQHKGPGGDPSIKSEFGRMFSGLGSGIGGGHGITTPSRGSPMPQSRIDASELPSGELDSLEMVRSGSRGLKGRRRFKEEDGRANSEMGDRIGTPSGAKRMKHSHTPAAHHHHPHIVQYVSRMQEGALQLTNGSHHHHKPEDEFAAATSQPRGSTPNAFVNKLNTSLNSTLPQTSTPSGPHHHHHYPPHHHSHNHGHVHYHHGASSGSKAPTPTPVALPMPKRTTIIDSKEVFDSVADKPRLHLGSKLYKVSYELPPTSSMLTPFANPPGPLGISDKFGYTMKPEPIPKFEVEKANCTFTVRVPRIYLTAEKREEICRHRFLWGSDIYSDDSDPIAAAMHSGWLLGEWPRDVDAEMLELTNGSRRNGLQPEMEIPNVMEAPLPTGPIVPPQDMDCHITLLLLPPLTRYPSVTKNGIKSRQWGSNHDGLSFTIHKIEWVDEGAFGGGAMEERGGAARRKRLQLLAAQRQKIHDVIRKDEMRVKAKKKAVANGRGTNGINGGSVGREQLTG